MQLFVEERIQRHQIRAGKVTRGTLSPAVLTVEGHTESLAQVIGQEACPMGKADESKLQYRMTSSNLSVLTPARPSSYKRPMLVAMA